MSAAQCRQGFSKFFLCVLRVLRGEIFSHTHGIRYPHVVPKQLGCSELEIESDPNAVGFYEKMDGQPRILPVLLFSLPSPGSLGEGRDGDG